MKLEDLNENAYYRVDKPITVHKGTARGTSGPSFSAVKLNDGDEIHNLQGGTFALQNGKVIASIHVSDPSKHKEGDFHASRHNPSGFKSRELKKLVDSGDLEVVSKADATPVTDYRKGTLG